jgi:RHS repeat-associated protein
LGDSYEGQLKNNYLYQGAFSELDDDIGWHDFMLRNYDAQIGRWVQQDPYQEFASPYSGMGNDPVNYSDESGGSVSTPPDWIYNSVRDQYIWFDEISSLKEFNNSALDKSIWAYDEGKAKGGFVHDFAGLPHAYLDGGFIHGAQLLENVIVSSTKKASGQSGIASFMINEVLSGKLQEQIQTGVKDAVVDAAVGTYDFVRKDAWRLETYGNMLQTGIAAHYSFQSIFDPNAQSKLQELDGLFGTSMSQQSTAITNYIANAPNWTAKEWSCNITTGGIFFFGPKVIKSTGEFLTFGYSAKWLRASGGRINGFTISKGEGYGAKPRFDVHPLLGASKRSNSLPAWIEGKTFPHYHRGKGGNLRRHRPWENGWNDKSFWDRF